MSRRGAAQRVKATALAALALACMAGLWLIHLAWPHLAGSLTSPLTTNGVERIVLCIAWLLVVCLALAVFRHEIRNSYAGQALHGRVRRRECCRVGGRASGDPPHASPLFTATS